MKQKDVDKFFRGMEAIGVDQVFLSRVNHKETLDNFNEYFYTKSRNAKRHVWGESLHSGEWSYCAEHSVTRKTLKITFIHYTL